MSMKKPKPASSDQDPPSWVDDSRVRTTSYTEAELDLLQDGTLEGIHDTPAWLELVEKVGVEEARRILRSQIIMRDENAQKQTRH